jgi:hypothetical protein
MCILEDVHDKGQSFDTEWEDGACPIIVLRLIMSVSTCFSLVGNLAHNATRLSLSNEPFLLIRSCVFMQITYRPHLLLTKLVYQEFFSVFLFFPKNKHNPMFSQ